MQHDEVIWQVIRHKHCSFMAKIETGIFCRNPYNVTGICNRSSCPLANSRYATIRDHDGVFYLYMKTIERAHMPNKLWERVKLPRNYEKALEIIDKHLELLNAKEKIMTVPTKEKKREARREEKAEKAAVLEKSIEKELLERLKKGVYGDIYNYPVDKYNEILDKEVGKVAVSEDEEEEEPEIEYVEGYEELEEEEDMEDFSGLPIGEDDDDNVEMDDDDDEEENVFVDLKRGRKGSARKLEKEEPAAKSKKKVKVHVELEQKKDGGEKEKEVVNRIIRRWRLFRLLKQMPLDVVNDLNGLQRVILSEPCGSSVEVLLNGGQVVSWKNDRGEELLCQKQALAILGGISISFPQAGSLGPFEQHEYLRHRLWSLEENPLDQAHNRSQTSANLILKPFDKDSKIWPCRKAHPNASVRNAGDKSFSFTFAIRNYLSVSDISEVRVEGLETLDYLDNMQHKQRFTEQADALTFDSEVNRTYLNTPPKIAIIDHGKKRTFVLRKQGLPDAGVWNPWDKPSKSSVAAKVGDEYKMMVSVDSGVYEKPIVLKPFQVWRGYQEIGTVSSSYCGQLDPRKVVQGIMS
ncbi:putative glucose-6-phosphate 1-epimerase [Sesamum angolense]|uniref:Glucose-6-phosphate 1-epimerase n=1 Tax=Sesamum angolense TaxID=2727404 RepID=A0AAE1WU38_9LAMI|nr:putative glucose-6-phosphate 1-epimerase [Sesamum angolense]